MIPLWLIFNRSCIRNKKRMKQNYLLYCCNWHWIEDWECTVTNWTKWEADTHKAQLSSEKCITVRGCLATPFVDKVIKIKIIRLSKRTAIWKNRDGVIYLNWQMTFIIQTLQPPTCSTPEGALKRCDMKWMHKAGENNTITMRIIKAIPESCIL